MSATTRVEVLTHDRAMLGESPLWHESEHALYWVDIVGRSVFRYDPSHRFTTTVASGEMVTALSETSVGGLVFVTPEALVAWNGGDVTRLAPLSLPERVRTNDGKCDPAGRLWFGTMDYETREPIAELFMYDGDRVRPVESGIILSNGLGWSPDREIMYHVDSIRRVVYSYRYEQATGEVADREVLADMSPFQGVPDGLAVDVDGNLWVAIYDGWCVRVVSPNGQVVHEESLEVQKPTSVAFGGPDRSDLYVTSAAQGLSAAELDDQPFSGCLLRLDPGTSGLAPGVFAV